MHYLRGGIPYRERMTFDQAIKAKFFSNLDRFGDSAALVADNRTITYEALEGMVAEQARRLAGRRHLVFLEALNNPQAISIYLACLRSACPIYLFGPGEVEKTKRLVDIYQPDIVFTGAGENRVEQASREFSSNLRVLLSTSGTTGSPKLVKLSSTNICSNAEAIVEYLRIENTDRAITTLQFNYSYGMSILNSHLSAGASIVLTDLSMIDNDFWHLTKKLGVTSLSGVPHNFDLLRKRLNELTDLPALRYLTQAGGRLAPEKCVEFAVLARQRGWKFFVMYGQTEASPRMAYLPPDLAQSHPDHIGVAIPGGELLLLNAEGSPIDVPEMEGELAYRGPNVMMGYAQTTDDLATDTTPTILKTGDIAKRNEIGLFKIVGRSSRFVKPFGLRVNLDEVEAEANRWLTDAVCTGNDKMIVIASNIGDDSTFKECIAYLSQRYKLPIATFRALKVEAIPRLSNGKVDYKAIMSLTSPQPHRLMLTGRALSEDIAAILNVERIEPGDTFISLGGDSLSYVNVAMLIEEQKGQLPKGWETISIASLDGLPNPEISKPSWRKIESNVLLRALAILMVVFDHTFADFAIGSASIVLFLIAGLNFSRFQVPKIIQGAAFEMIKSVAARVIIPYYLFVSATLAFHGKFFLPQYLFYGNFTEGVSKASGERLLVPYWFIENYIIYVAVFSIVFSIPSLRTLAKEKAWPLSLTLFGAFMIVAIYAAEHRHEIIFNDKTSISAAWMFLLGWLINQAKTILRKHLVALIGAASLCYMIYLERPHDILSQYLFLALLSFLTLIYLPELRLPKFIVLPASFVASASMYIYISHPAVVRLFRHEANLLSALAAVFLSAIVGIALWKLSLLLEQRFPKSTRAGKSGTYQD